MVFISSWRLIRSKLPNSKQFYVVIPKSLFFHLNCALKAMCVFKCINKNDKKNSQNQYQLQSWCHLYVRDLHIKLIVWRLLLNCCAARPLSLWSSPKYIHILFLHLCFSIKCCSIFVSITILIWFKKWQSWWK